MLHSTFNYIRSVTLVHALVISCVTVPVAIAQPPTPSGLLLESRINPVDGAVLIYIPTGDFIMGEPGRGDNSPHTVHMSGYWIYKDLVTVAMYRKFCVETNRPMPPSENTNPGWARINDAMVCVSYYDVMAYSKWAGVSLQTDAQFEKAARGTDGRTYPWGNTFDPKRVWGAVTARGDGYRTHQAARYGLSPYGCTDMAGNAWEWCADRYDGGFPMSERGAVDPLNTAGGGDLVMRGGSWADTDQEYFRSARRSNGNPARHNHNDGFRCAVSGPANIEPFRAYIKAHPELVSAPVDEEGNLPLNVAAICGYTDSAAILIQAGANVMAKNPAGETPLHSAGHGGDGSVAKLLLQHGAKVDEKDNQGETPLMSAARYGNVELASLLLQNGASIKATSDTGDTAMTIALGAHQLFLSQLLVKSGADINTRSPINGYTPLIAAAAVGDLSTLKFLLNGGADKNIKSNDGSLPIHIAVERGQIESMLELVIAKCDVNATNASGHTPLILAARLGNVNMVKDLLTVGADPSLINRAGNSARDEAVKYGKTDVVRVLDGFDAFQQKWIARDTAAGLFGPAFKRSYATWTDPKLMTHDVYSDDFTDSKVGTEWRTATTSVKSNDHAALRVSVTPSGGRHFLGDFGNQAVTLAVSSLPEHREISISFDLFILRTWDGNHLVDGPDIWNLSVLNGPSLINTSFNNYLDTMDTRRPFQSFPNDYPAYHPCRTGASENNTLGFTYDPGKPNVMDAVYKLQFTFPHTERSIAFNFLAGDLQEMSDESWGITNVHIAVGALPPPPPVAATIVTKPAPAKPATPATAIAHSPAHPISRSPIHHAPVKKPKRIVKKTTPKKTTPAKAPPPKKKQLTP